MLGVQLSYAQTTYYSSNSGSGGNWNLNTSWTTSPDGSGGVAGPPSRTDHIVILAGHTIVINATNDNGSTGVSPDGLNRPNVGTFAASGTACFYQTGNITVNAGGTLDVQGRIIIENYTLINGNLTATGDIINLGKLTVNSTAVLTSDDDLILTWE